MSADPPDPGRLATAFARTVVVGCSGCGKSTFARAAAEVLQVPRVALDDLYWGPGWQPRPEADFASAADAATAGPAWIVDGNYRAVRDIVWPRATAIVWLDHEFPTVFRRVLARTVRRIATREALFSGNRESFRRSFLSRESILWWTVTQYGRYRREYGDRCAAAGAGPPHWYALRRTAEVAALLDALRSVDRAQAAVPRRPGSA